jgi:NADH-quinone oxidoreductase subunit N
MILPVVSLRLIAPPGIAFATGLLILLVDLILPKGRKGLLAVLALVGLILAGSASSGLWGRYETAFRDMVVADNLSSGFAIIICLTAFLVVLLSRHYIQRERIDLGEYYALLMFSTCGLTLFVSGKDLIILFLGLEVFSIALYILCGFNLRQLRSAEAALKYFLLGSFASAFLLYGIALIYGTTGSTNLDKIAQVVVLNRWGNLTVLMVGVGFVLVGLGFKAAAVPFHFWTPDVYEGAPTPVTAFMAGGVKAAAFVAVLRVFSGAFGDLYPDWARILSVIAILTMVVGNVIAVAQTSLKRLLAYSSIAHAGYLLVAVVANSTLGIASISFYVLSYVLMTVGAFGILILIGQPGEGNLELKDVSGLSRSRPWLAAAMTILLLSLAGIPPTAGFVAKWYVFTAALKEGFLSLTLIGVLTSVIGVFYYLRVIVYMYMREPVKHVAEAPAWSSWTAALAVTIAVAGVLLIGLFPGSLLDIAQVLATGVR